MIINRGIEKVENRNIKEDGGPPPTFTKTTHA